MDPVPLKIGSHVYFPAFFHRCKNAYVGRVIAFVKNFVTKVGVKSQLRFTPDSIENDVWLAPCLSALAHSVAVNCQ